MRFGFYSPAVCLSALADHDHTVDSVDGVVVALAEPERTVDSAHKVPSSGRAVDCADGVVLNSACNIFLASSWRCNVSNVEACAAPADACNLLISACNIANCCLNRSSASLIIACTAALLTAMAPKRHYQPDYAPLPCNPVSLSSCQPKT